MQSVILRFIGSGRTQRVRVERNAFLSVCAFCAPRRRVSTLANSEALAAATPLPRGQEKLTKASDLHISQRQRKRHRQRHRQRRRQRQRDDDDNHETVESPVKIHNAETKKPFSFHSGRGRT